MSITSPAVADQLGIDLGHAVLRTQKYHDKFWVELNNKIDNKNFQRIQIFIILTAGFILESLWYNIFTLVFGSLTPMYFPLGFIKLSAYSFIGYVVGFEIGYNYMQYIYKLTSKKLTINKIIQEIKKPIKKRSLSDVEDYCNGKFCECENLFTCDKKKRETKKDS
jgi:hypothetical protein